MPEQCSDNGRGRGMPLNRPRELGRVEGRLFSRDIRDPMMAVGLASAVTSGRERALVR